MAVAALESDRWADLALLTGNDDTIVHDLITPYRRTVNGRRFPHLLDEDFVATFLASEDGALDVRR